MEYCGFSIKEVLERYGDSNYYAVAKAISRIKKRVKNEKGLGGMVNHILSISKM